MAGSNSISIRITRHGTRNGLWHRHPSVMAGLDPAICHGTVLAWTAGPGPAMTMGRRCGLSVSSRAGRLPPAGNIDRHEYEDMAARGVWDTLVHQRPPLRAVVERELMATGRP
jgi:hypothetical protein